MSFMEKAQLLVAQYYNSKLEKSNPEQHPMLTTDDVYVVWFSKALQNWKCLISTTVPDGMYYEVTYNGDAKETYVDAYKKWENVCVSDGENLHEF